MRLKSFIEVFKPIPKDNSKHNQITYHKIFKGGDGAIGNMIIREDDKINEQHHANFNITCNATNST